MTSSTKVILGIVGAAAAGVVIGMLLAPEKGADLRDRIGRTAGDWANKATDLFKKGVHEAEDLRDKTMSAARNVRSSAENKVRENMGS